MNDFANHCFVCEKEVDAKTAKKNHQLNLPVCDDCINTEAEKKALDDFLDGMADGYVCGCD
jgi:hypothetical protein